MKNIYNVINYNDMSISFYYIIINKLQYNDMSISFYYIIINKLQYNEVIYYILILYNG
jgi:hypothetical protein